MFDTGNTGFMLVSTSLVMLMTPGLAFFYGGLVGRKNVLAIMIQSFVSMGVTTVLLTAKGEEADKVLGLGLGADDYVTKPFSLKELLARVRAVLRRYASAQEKPSPEKLKAGALELDAAKVEVRLKGSPLELTSKEFELLKALMACGDRVLTREDLLEKAWGMDSSLEVETRTVDVHIGTLRRKLKGEGRRIVTVKNYGYRFDAE